MKEASWNDCVETNSVKKISPDIERASSLVKTSEERISIINKTNEKNCNFVFEDYYTSMLELLQALVIKRGYNILNHLCLGYYLRDVLEKGDLFRMFDDLRYKRNALTYYGNKMDFEIAKASIEKCKELINKINVLLK